MNCPQCLEDPCICGFDAETYNRDVKRFLPDPPEEINIDLDLLNDNDEAPELQFEDEDGPSYRESDDDDDEFFNDTL